MNIKKMMKNCIIYLEFYCVDFGYLKWNKNILKKNDIIYVEFYCVDGFDLK